MNEFTKKLRKLAGGVTVVYIDAANLERSVKDMFVRPDDVPDALKHKQAETLCWAVDYRKFRDFFKATGNCKDIRFYTAEFASESHQKFRYFLKKSLGFKLVTKPLKEYRDHTEDTPHRKANFDVEMAVDCVAGLHGFDTLILFSGDCDFEYLVKFLRGRNKSVIGFSRSGHVAKELPPVLSHYFDIGNFRSEILIVKERPEKAKNPEPFGSGSRS